MRVVIKIIVIILILAIAAATPFVGLKVAKKIKRHYTKPRMYETKEILKTIQSIPNTGGVKIFTASSLDRIFQDGRTLLKPSFSDKAVLAAAGNEYESFQIVIQSPKDLTGLTIKFSDLVDAKTGSKLDRANLSSRMEGYVQTITPYYPVKFVGLWPDPLIPKRSYEIKKDLFQPFWITVYVPPQTPKGDYAGTILLEAEELTEQKIPISLHVYDFSLPIESSLKTAFDFYGHLTKIQYPQGDEESNEAWHARLDALNDQYIITMLKYRMNPILNIDPTSQWQLSNIDRYRVLGLNNFAIGRHGGTFENNWPKDKASIEELFSTYRTYGEVLKFNKLLDYTYIYTWDEGDIGNPVVPKVASMIHRAYPGLKNMVCYHGLWDPLKHPDWGKDIDIWTFQIDDFNEEKMRKLQAMGIEIWMYISGPSGTGSPNLAMDFDSIDYRIIPWICWKYDIRGFLYWCVNYWPTENPFINTRNTKWQQNANGLLFYPGKNNPLASLRMEIFRDGMEDYEYIQILLNKLQIIKARDLESKLNADFKESIRLLSMDDNLIKSHQNFNRDGDYLKNRRNAIAQKIEKLEEILSK